MQAENVVERSVAMPSKSSIAKTDPNKQAEVASVDTQNRPPVDT
jgi:hypothetical protein